MARRLAVILLAIGCLAQAADEGAWPGGIAFLDLGPAAGTEPVVRYEGAYHSRLHAAQRALMARGRGLVVAQCV